MRIHRDERGQTILLVALSLPLLLGFIGIATDVGALFKDKRTLQTAADAAAIAGALNLNNVSNPNSIVVAAKNASAVNGYTDGAHGVTVTVPTTPQWPASNYLGQAGYVEVTVTKTEPTIFLTLFGYPSVTVLARAVATNDGPPAACFYTTGQDQTGFSLITNGVSATTVTATQCGLVVDSNASPPISVPGAGGPGSNSLSMKSIGTVGNCDGACGNVSPTPVSGIVPYSDPLSYLPQFTCNIDSCTNGSTTLPCLTDPKLNGSGALFPACYNGLSIQGSGIVTFNPGTYVINGPINFTGSNILTGTGVTFYINSGTININDFTTLNFYAPNTPGAPYNGILFAQVATTPQTIKAVSGSVLVGILYFPNTQLNMTTTTNVGIDTYANFVAQSLTFTGTFALRDYASAPGVTSSPLRSVVLVE